MKTFFKFKNKKISLEIKECKGIHKFLGLMFSRREKASALLFDFGKPTQIVIHSLFCTEFIGIWIDSDGKVVEIKRVKPWKLSIKPKKPFRKLIEIPVNGKYSEVLKILSRYHS